MVNGADGGDPRLCAKESHQVSDLGGLRSRMDRHPAPPSKSSLDCWEMYFDGSVMKTGAGAGLLFISPRGEHVRYVVRLNFPASNNMAEYEALLAGLKIALELGIKRLDIRGDSQLVVDQVMKESSCHDEKMAAYCQAVRKLEDKFDGLELHHIARRYNEEADELAKIASGRATVPPNVFAKDIDRPSITIATSAQASTASDTQGAALEPTSAELLADEDEPMGYEACSGDEDEAEAMEIDEVSAPRDWRSPYLDWLDQGVLPNDRTEARRVARKAKRFLIIEGELYRRGASGVLQRCIPIPEGKELILDIHAGVCGHHATPRTLVGNAFRQGFYWPTAVADATEVVRTCEGCQFYARKTHLPAQALQTIPITWPFAVWGLDLVGPMAKAPGGFTHLLVAIDKFSKWIEARPISRIKSEQAVLFFTDIIHRFGVPNSIITDNGTQFTGKKFLEFCDNFHIRVDWSAVAHPQTNGQVERANGMILQGLKPRIHNKLKKFGHKWVQELPSVIWSLRTTPSRATGFSPYFLVFGAEAILPTDLEYGSPRLRAYQEQRNCQAREDSLDQVDEARDVALLHSARYQQSLRRQQARRIRHRDLCKGDLVLRLRQDNRGRHKLSPPWEGPYIVAEVLKPGTYKLADEDGHVLTNAWNIQQLRRFYP
ncbi:reverse transcriptase-like protein [Robertmurraya kyonggiensis]|uniref:Reverse transcriptase-like protein n=1 Tax=Robertmurraya kyonggiensis TaxID=1037680 RepID=A0A4V5P0F2_9BACI|nr:reverse transcriptase-like protein [Robertmurraya kyonggiensis]